MCIRDRFIGIGYHDKDDWIATDSFLEPNIVYKVEYEHFPNKELLVSIDGTQEFKYDLSSRPLAVVDNPIVFIGVNKHTTKDLTDIPDIDLHNFKIFNKSGLICHHDFEQVIHGKAIDNTGNLNFIYQIG